MIKQYELMVLFATQGEGIGKETGVVEKLIKKYDGKITSTDDWGEKPLAFGARGYERGHYVVYEIEIEGQKLRKLDKQFRLQKLILRWMAVEKKETQPSKKETSSK